MPPVRTLTAVSLCLLLATTVAACAEEKSGTAPSAVPSGGAASPQEVATFAAFVIAYERRYCESARACCGSFGQTALSQAACTGEPPPKPPQSDEDRFDAKAAARCLQSLSARGCGIDDVAIHDQGQAGCLAHLGNRAPVGLTAIKLLAGAAMHRNGFDAQPFGQGGDLGRIAALVVPAQPHL